MLPQPPSPLSEVAGGTAGWGHLPDGFLPLLTCFPLCECGSAMAAVPQGCHCLGMGCLWATVPWGVAGLVWGDLSPVRVSLLYQGAPPSKSMSSAVSSMMPPSACPLHSVSFSFSKRVSHPHVSPAPVAAFFSCVSADVQWAAVLGHSQWCWSQQDLVVTSPGPPPHRAPVAPCYPHPAI